jgi:hypothetical protein
MSVPVVFDRHGVVSEAEIGASQKSPVRRPHVDVHQHSGHVMAEQRESHQRFRPGLCTIAEEGKRGRRVSPPAKAPSLNCADEVASRAYRRSVVDQLIAKGNQVGEGKHPGHLTPHTARHGHGHSVQFRHVEGCRLHFVADDLRGVDRPVAGWNRHVEPVLRLEPRRQCETPEQRGGGVGVERASR